MASACTTILSYMAKVFGRSVYSILIIQPMLTCFIRTEFFNVSQNITVMMFLLIPFSFIFYTVLLGCSMCCTRKIRNDLKLQTLFFKYMSYISCYLVFNLPMFSLYIFTVYKKIQPDTFLSWLSYVYTTI